MSMTAAKPEAMPKVSWRVICVPSIDIVVRDVRRSERGTLWIVRCEPPVRVLGPVSSTKSSYNLGAAIQSKTSVMEGGASRPCGRLARKRRPSGLTS